VNLRSITEAIIPRAEKVSQTPEEISAYERLGYPYRFQPVLRVSEAAMLALRALLRIFLVSALFGTWGAGATVVWSHTGNRFLRGAGLTVLTACLVVAAVWMLVVTARVGQKRAP